MYRIEDPREEQDDKKDSSYKNDLVAVVLGIVALFISYRYYPGIYLEDNGTTVFVAIATVSAALLGFLLVIFQLASELFMRRDNAYICFLLKVNKNYINEFFTAIEHAIWLFMFSLFLSLLTLIFSKYNAWLFSIQVAILSAAGWFILLLTKNLVNRLKKAVKESWNGKKYKKYSC